MAPDSIEFLFICWKIERIDYTKKMSLGINEDTKVANKDDVI